MSPRDDKGRYVPLVCPMLNCGGGKLVHDDGRLWRCDGLAAPDRDDQELYACPFTHYDGERYESHDDISRTE